MDTQNITLNHSLNAQDISTVPQTINLQMDSLPVSLKAFEKYNQFIGYVLVPRVNNLGKMDKIPFNYNAAHKDDAHNTRSWMSANEAFISAELFGNDYGVGFVLTDKDPFCCVDIDDCLETSGDISTAKPIALELMRIFPKAAMEISSSGKGLHLFFSYKGSAPPHARKNQKLNIELYTERQFIALTGIHANGDAATDYTEELHKAIEIYFPKAVAAETNNGNIAQQWADQVAKGFHSDWDGDREDDKLIERMLNSKSSRAKFGDKASLKDLWEGNVEALVKAYPDASHESGYDESSADAALACHLAFWTGKDADRTLRLMQNSGLKREKWDRDDYLPRTILKAFSIPQNVYTSRSKTIPLPPQQYIKTLESNTLSRLEVIPAAKFASIKGSPWIIKGILPRTELAMIFGASGSGKSFLVLDFAFAIARGIEWCGHKVRQGRVVYIAAEGAGGLRKRLTAYEQHHVCGLDSISLDIIPAAPNFLGQSDLSILIENIGQATVIILDTLACIAAGGDENSSTDMGRVLANCKLLHDATGALVILVHHMGKDTSRGARGWSGIRAAVDSEIEVTSSNDGFKVRITKLKDGEDGKTYNFRLISVDLGVDDDGEPITSCVIEHVNSFVMPQKTSGKNVKLIIETIENLSQDGQISMQAIIDHTISRMPIPKQGKRDQRKTIIKTALDALAEKGYFKIHNEIIFTSPNALSEAVFNNEHDYITEPAKSATSLRDL